MTTLDEHGRPEAPIDGDEIATLTGFLDYHRATLEWKCRGLDSAGLNTRAGKSTMTLGGIMKHVAYVEDGWLSQWITGAGRGPRWADVDWKADIDWDWHSAADDTPEQIFEIWHEAVDVSRANVANALADGGLEQRSVRTWPTGEAPTLRWILAHMIEEYARHNGHADILREAVDGETGE